MDFAPQHDWQYYDSIVAKFENARDQAQTPEEKFERYASLYNLIHSAKPKRAPDHPLEIARWQEKLQLRRKMARIFRKLDEWKLGNDDSTNAQ